MDESEVILSKIQKLLRLSTSSNPNEAAVAAAKAQELLLKYNLSMTQVEGYSAEKAEPIGEEYQRFGQNVVNWKVTLSHHVARNNLCRVFTSGSALVWVGKSSNIQVARYLTDTMIADIERLGNEYWNGILKLRELNLAPPDLVFIHGRTWKQGFYLGAIDTIKERLRASKQHLMNADANMNALVVKEDDALAAYLKRFNLHAGASYRSTNNSGYSAGREAGGLVSFKTGVGSGGASSTKQIRG